MNDKKIFVVSATKEADETNTLIYKSLTKLLRYRIIDGYEIVTSNTDSISSVYNRFLTSQYKDCIVVFVHDDVEIGDLWFKERIYEGMKSAGILGVAGSYGNLRIQNPVLWHLISDEDKLLGEVAHYSPGADPEDPLALRATSKFGRTTGNAAIIDGVFIAVDVEFILEKDLKFDENNPAKFHFYDLNFSFDAVNRNIGIKVVPIRITHKSAGLTHQSSDFMEGQSYFIQKVKTFINERTETATS